MTTEFFFLKYVDFGGEATVKTVLKNFHRKIVKTKFDFFLYVHVSKKLLRLVKLQL
jgi:hypothetical protein